MQTLAPYEARFLEFAEGWLELGNLSEAERALEQIGPMYRTHAKVLELRCRIYGAASKWDQCMIVAEMLHGPDAEPSDRLAAARRRRARAGHDG